MTDNRLPLGHEAVQIVLRLLELSDRSMGFGLAVRASEPLAELHERAKRLKARLAFNAARPRDVRDLAFCGLCDSYHEAACSDPVAGVTS